MSNIAHLKKSLDFPSLPSPGAASVKKHNPSDGTETLEQAYDNAMAATLSAAAYTENIWSIQTIGSDSGSGRHFSPINAADDKDPHQRLRAALIHSTCKYVEGVDIPEIGTALDPIGGAHTEFSYLNGVYTFGSFACAALLERKALDGSPRLELCFRGTEPDTAGNLFGNIAGIIKGYFLGAYPDLRGHYERHRPLIDHAVRIANERHAKGEAIKLNVSGHSLGGAMAEMFLQEDAKKLAHPSLASGITFGSPGIGTKQSAFAMLVFGFVRLLASKLHLLSDNPKLASTLNGNGRMDAEPVNVSERPKLTQFIDPDDPIPKLGILGGYAPTGKILFSRTPTRDELTGKPLAGSLLDIARHSSAKYENSRFYALCRACARNENLSPDKPLPGPLAVLELAREAAKGTSETISGAAARLARQTQRSAPSTLASVSPSYEAQKLLEELAEHFAKTDSTFFSHAKNSSHNESTSEATAHARHSKLLRP